MRNIELKVQGMSCSGCEKRVENALNTIAGILEVKANHNENLVKINMDKDIEIDEIKETIEDLGYEVVD